MRAEIEDWKNGWFGIRLEIKASEIEGLINKLTMLKNDPDQHFHLSSTYKGAGGIGDIEVSVQSAAAPSNIEASGRALSPGDDIETRPV